MSADPRACHHLTVVVKKQEEVGGCQALVTHERADARKRGTLLEQREFVLQSKGREKGREGGRVTCDASSHKGTLGSWSGRKFVGQPIWGWPFWGV
eukprot:365907-Chlamydomonas_euryale.AAC.7